MCVRVNKSLLVLQLLVCYVIFLQKEVFQKDSLKNGCEGDQIVWYVYDMLEGLVVYKFYYYVGLYYVF